MPRAMASSTRGRTSGEGGDGARVEAARVAAEEDGARAAPLERAAEAVDGDELGVSAPVRAAQAAREREGRRVARDEEGPPDERGQGRREAEETVGAVLPVVVDGEHRALAGEPDRRETGWFAEGGSGSGHFAAMAVERRRSRLCYIFCP